MYISIPNGGITTTSTGCSTSAPCLPNPTTVSVFLPGQAVPIATYTFTTAGTSPGTNPTQPFGVQVEQGADKTPFANIGRGFFGGFDYLYDPINGFVGYRVSDTSGNTGILAAILALQGNLALPSGFATGFSTYLMAGTTLQQTGAGTFNGSIFGPGGLTLQSGAVTLAAANTYAGGTTVNGGTLTIANTGSIVGNLTVNPGATFVNNGTVNTPGIWQLNQGSFTNNNAFLGNLANTGTASNAGTLTGSVINGAAGSFANNGTVAGSVLNMGIWSGNGSVVGNLSSSGIMAPGNSIGTVTVTGNFAQTSAGTFLTEVVRLGAERPHQCQRRRHAGWTGVGQRIARHGLRAFHHLHHPQCGGWAFRHLRRRSTSSIPSCSRSLSYDANNAYLNLQVGGFAAQALNNTQYAVGTVLDANAPTATGDFATVLGTLATATAPQGQAFLTAISGNNYAGFSTSMVQGAQLFMNNFANQSGGGGSPVSNRVALAEACDVACDAPRRPSGAPGAARWAASAPSAPTSRSAPSPTMPAALPPASIGRSPTASAWV